MSDMTSNEKDHTVPEKKKISLQEAIKQKMASKLQQQSTGSKDKDFVRTNQKMKSQLTKKPNNQRKRTGV